MMSRFAKMCALLVGAIFSTLPALADWQERLPKFVNRVEELAFLKSEAARLGVRVYLTGGTAASVAFHLRDEADKKNYGHAFRSIFSRVQDLDILIDSDANQAKQLEDALKRKYPYIIAGGEKPVWEVTPLFENNGVKIARVANEDFLLQNNDSLSRAALEVSDPPAGAPRVRDLANWEKPANDFLSSVREKKISFYRNPRHRETSFFLEGRNPEIVSAVRYLQKAFRHDLAIPPEARKEIQAIVSGFDEAKDLTHPYVRNWLAHNGKKLFLNAKDIVRAPGARGPESKTHSAESRRRCWHQRISLVAERA